MNFVLQTEISQLKELRKQVDTAKIGAEIHSRKFSMNDIGISSRLLFHWEKSGLLLENYEAGKWKRFDLIEYTWLKIIMEMRRFELSLDIIRKAKECLVFDFTVNELHNKDDFYAVLSQISEPADAEKVKKILGNLEVRQLIEQSKINYLEIVILYIILLKGNYSLLVNMEGECIVLKHTNIDDFLDIGVFTEFLSGTFLSISISSILKDFMINNELTSPKRKLTLLTEAESFAIQTIRDENVTSVKVKKGENNTVEMVEELRKEKVDKAARFMDIILTHGYQTIEIKAQSGKIVHCENLIKHKIKNDTVL